MQHPRLTKWCFLLAGLLFGWLGWALIKPPLVGSAGLILLYSIGWFHAGLVVEKWMRCSRKHILKGEEGSKHK